VNIGKDAYEAVQALRNNPDWVKLVAAMGNLASKTMNDAIDAAEAVGCGYAKAVRDMYVEFAAATANVRVNQVQKPGVAKAKE
jgi:hypothetical protein